MLNFLIYLDIPKLMVLYLYIRILIFSFIGDN